MLRAEVLAALYCDVYSVACEWNDVPMFEIRSTLLVEQRDATSKEEYGNFSFHGNWGIPSSLFFFLSHIPPIPRALRVTGSFPLIIICIYLHTKLLLNRIKGTRLGEWNGLSTDKLSLHLRRCMCSFCSPLQDNGPK